MPKSPQGLRASGPPGTGRVHRPLSRQFDVGLRLPHRGSGSLPSSLCVFFIEIDGWRASTTGVTANPAREWVAQQARYPRSPDQFRHGSSRRYLLLGCLCRGIGRLDRDSLDRATPAGRHEPLPCSYPFRWVTPYPPSLSARASFARARSSTRRTNCGLWRKRAPISA